jgi:uncharacterized protein YjbI with pentapeptide repeats
MEKNGCRYCETRNLSSSIEDRFEGGERGLCLLHDPDERKDAALFEALLRAKIGANDYNLSGLVFPAGTAHFDGFQFNADTDFSGAVFLGDASFHSARFSGAITSFSGAKFSGRANFSNTIFECGAVFFSRAIFSGPADFRGSRFDGETANFTDARFDDISDFRGAEFLGLGVYFTETAFFGVLADFSHANFSAVTNDFKWIQFSGETDFSNSEFRGMRTTFRESKFSDTAKFEHTRQLSAITVFDRCRFSGGGCTFSKSQMEGEEISFRGANFAGESASFAGTEFRCSSVDFGSARFSADRVDFSEAIFSGDAHDFRKTIFSGRIITFSGARFHGKNQFDQAVFPAENTPVFAGAVFLGPISFQNAKFPRGAKFDGAKFLSDVDFAKAVFPVDLGGAVVSFRHAEFSGPVLSLRRVDLRQTLFANSSLTSKFQVEKTRWPCKRYLLHLRGRRTCTDELHAFGLNAFIQASDALASLERALRISGSSKLAADFAFSARECRRKARQLYSPLRYLELFFGAWLTGYGQKMWNIALTTAIIILSFAVLLFLSGGTWSSVSSGTGDTGGGLAEIASRCGGCFFRSFAAFFTGGLLNLQFTTRFEKVLLLAEGMLGLITMSTFSVLFLRRNGLLPRASRSDK